MRIEMIRRWTHGLGIGLLSATLVPAAASAQMPQPEIEQQEPRERQAPDLEEQEQEQQIPREPEPERPQQPMPGAEQPETRMPGEPSVQLTAPPLCDEAPGQALERLQTPRQVSGNVVAMKTIEVQGAGTQNLVALIATSRGDHRLVVDLGPPEQLQQVEIGHNEEIAVEGVVRQIGERQLLIANRIQADGGTFRIDRQAQEQYFRQQRTGEQPMQQPQREGAPIPSPEQERTPQQPTPEREHTPQREPIPEREEQPTPEPEIPPEPGMSPSEPGMPR